MLVASSEYCENYREISLTTLIFTPVPVPGVQHAGAGLSRPDIIHGIFWQLR